MITDIDKFEGLALDTAGNKASREKQHELAEVVLALLDRDYQIYLFSSNQKDDLTTEEFRHARLKFLPGPMPPSESALQEAPELTSPRTLWVTDDRRLLDWLGERRLNVATTRSNHQLGATGVKIGALADLVTLLDPGSQALRRVANTLVSLKEPVQGTPFLVGVGGPPRSDYQNFTVELKRWLESLGCPLVELLDLSHLLGGAGRSGAATPFQFSAAHPVGGDWLERVVLQPLREGNPVFVDSPPEGLPELFLAHFPLYISKESIVLILGETVFAPPVAASLHASILLEVSPRETTRRMYEIPEGQAFDDNFLAQYMAAEGAAYKAYLRDNEVEGRATLRISAEKPGRLVVTYPAGP